MEKVIHLAQTFLLEIISLYWVVMIRCRKKTVLRIGLGLNDYSHYQEQEIFTKFAVIRQKVEKRLKS